MLSSCPEVTYLQMLPSFAFMWLYKNLTHQLGVQRMDLLVLITKVATLCPLNVGCLAAAPPSQHSTLFNNLQRWRSMPRCLNKLSQSLRHISSCQIRKLVANSLIFASILLTSDMSLELINADLRASFELHRSRVLQLRRSCLARLFRILEISPNTTDPEELDIVRAEEWPKNAVVRLTNHIRSSADLYALITDGTRSPLPEEERLQIFTEIEATLRDRASLDTDPVALPEDFKQLCAVTDSLQGPALPMTESQIPCAFGGLRTPLASLKHPLLSPDQLKQSTGLWTLDYEASIVLDMGEVSGGAGGGSWLCWCKQDGTDDWRWRWATRIGYVQPPAIYEDVKELLDRYWRTYVDAVASSYDGDIDQEELL